MDTPDADNSHKLEADEPQPESEHGAHKWQMKRRTVLKAGAAVVGAGALGAGAVGTVYAAGASDSSASFVLPEGFNGDISDLKHVVILMQENRSFDHYMGQMQGVRGFQDKQILEFQDGTNVFSQRTSLPNGAIYPPYPATETTLNWINNHSFAVGANFGQWNTFIPNQAEADPTNTMGYYDPSFVPFYYSVAAQYTVCDMNFCSIHGPTIPNRYFLMTGTSDGETTNDGQNNYSRTNLNSSRGGGPWTTVPELLQASGIDWRIYSDNSGIGLGGSNQSTYIGEFGCNVVNSFKNFSPGSYSAATNPSLATVMAEGTGLIWRANSYVYGTVYDPTTQLIVPKPPTTPDAPSEANLEAVLSSFIAACQPGAQYPLPPVSWIVMPAAWSEHPAFTTAHGEVYTQKVLDTLQANPDIWNHTLFIVTYDENDGKFDHVLPPRPNAAATTEIDAPTSEAIGMGPRVPMFLISPWTRGGRRSSDVFDHTSIIKFLESWSSYMASNGVKNAAGAAVSPITCTNISSWRRSMAGDLTSAIDFAHPQIGPVTITDPSSTVAPTIVGADITPIPLGYYRHVDISENRQTGLVTATMSMQLSPSQSSNPEVLGRAASFAVFPDAYQAFACTQYAAPVGSPQQYSWDTTTTDGKYAFSIYSQDGFVCRFAGQVVPASSTSTELSLPRVEIAQGTGPDGTVNFTLHNDGSLPVDFTLTANDFVGGTQTFQVAGGASQPVPWPVAAGYYDVIITADAGFAWSQRYAGRLATI